MSLRLILLLLVQSALTLSCHKSATGISGGVEHKWQIVSLNGEAYRYVGQPQDYFDFKNGTLIEFYAGQYDTLSYTLANNTLTVQGSNITSAIPFQITVLNDTQLIIHGTNPRFPILQMLDSLRR